MIGNARVSLFAYLMGIVLMMACATGTIAEFDENDGSGGTTASGGQGNGSVGGQGGASSDTSTANSSANSSVNSSTVNSGSSSTFTGGSSSTFTGATGSTGTGGIPGQCTSSSQCPSGECCFALLVLQICFPIADLPDPSLCLP